MFPTLVHFVLGGSREVPILLSTRNIILAFQKLCFLIRFIEKGLLENFYHFFFIVIPDLNIQLIAELKYREKIRNFLKKMNLLNFKFPDCYCTAMENIFNLTYI